MNYSLDVLTVYSEAKYGKGRRKECPRFLIALSMISPSHIRKCKAKARSRALGLAPFQIGAQLPHHGHARA